MSKRVKRQHCPQIAAEPVPLSMPNITPITTTTFSWKTTLNAKIAHTAVCDLRKAMQHDL